MQSTENDLGALILGLLGLSGGSGILYTIYANRKAIWKFIKSLATTIADKRDTKEHPVATNGNGNGSAMKLTVLTLEGLQSEVEDLKSNHDALMESNKALAKNQQEMQEFWRGELRSFKTDMLITAGNMVNNRLVEPENNITRLENSFKALSLDNREWLSVAKSTIGIMQDTLMELKDVVKDIGDSTNALNSNVSKLLTILPLLAPPGALPPATPALVDDDKELGYKLALEAKRATDQVPKVEPTTKGDAA